MLSVRNIVVFYGGVQALKGISLEAEKGTVTGLIGSNGAGKTTTLKAISGLVPISSGEIWFGKRRINGKGPERIVSLGIVHVPEGKRLFLKMSVLDNLLAGAYLRKDTDKLGRDLERIFGYFPVLKRARFRLASQLSGGEQQMLAIGRGLMADPKMLLLDEPSLGLSPLLTMEVGRIIKRIAEEGVSILLIEQNAGLAFQLVTKVYVMETGSIVLEGDPKELQNHPHVREAYLGLAPVGAGVTASVREAPAAAPPESKMPRRWQDETLGARFQDKVAKERWQEKASKKAIADRTLQTEESEHRREVAGEFPQKASREVMQKAQVEPPSETYAFGRLIESESESRQWLSEKWEPSRGEARGSGSDRWRIAGKLEGSLPRKLTEEHAEAPFISQDLIWKGQRKPPVRKVKRTTVQIIKSPPSRKGD